MATYRCRSCRATFPAAVKRCRVCVEESAETGRDTCLDCGAPLVDAPFQTCPVCGSTDVDPVLAGRS